MKYRCTVKVRRALHSQEFVGVSAYEACRRIAMDVIYLYHMSINIFRDIEVDVEDLETGIHSIVVVRVRMAAEILNPRQGAE